MKITNTLLNAAALLAVTEAATITKFYCLNSNSFVTQTSQTVVPNHLLKQFIQLHQNNSLVKLKTLPPQLLAPSTH